MARTVLSLALILLPLAGCTQDSGRYPSLLPRPAEAVGLGTPPVRPPAVAAPDPALDARIADFSTALDTAQGAFTAAAQDAEAKIAVARGLPEGSDPWLDAQVALTALIVKRSATTDIIATLESTAIERGAAGLPPYPALTALLARATAQAAEQQARYKALEAVIGVP